MATVVGAALVLVPEALALSDVPDTTWRTNGPVRAMTRIGGRIYLGGTFTWLVSPTGQRVSVRNLAALDSRTGRPITSWRPRADASVRALTHDGTRVIAGGDFMHVDHAPRMRLAAFGATTGALDPSFRPTANSTVRALRRYRSRIYVGGEFTRVNGKTRGHVAALQLSGRLARYFSPTLALDRQVRGFGFSPRYGLLYIVGDFSSANGHPRQHVARVFRTSGVLGRWRPDEEVFDPRACEVRTICDWSQNVRTVRGHVFVGFCGGKNRLDALDPDTGRRQWRMWTSGDVKSMTLWGGRLIIGGHFHHMHRDGKSTIYYLQYLARLTYDGVPDVKWKVHLDSQQGTWDGMYALQPDGDRRGSHLWVGGAFEDTEGTFGHQSWLARFTL